MRFATTPRKPPVFVPDAIFRTLENRQAADAIAVTLMEAGIQAVVVPISTEGAESYQVGIGVDDWTEAESVVGKL